MINKKTTRLPESLGQVLAILALASIYNNSPILASSQSVLDPYADVQAPGSEVQAKAKEKGSKFKLSLLSHENKKKEAEQKIKSSQIVKIIPVKKQKTARMDLSEGTESPKLAVKKVKLPKPVKLIKNTPVNNAVRDTQTATLTTPQTRSVVTKPAKLAKTANTGSSPRLGDSIKQIKDGYVNTFKACGNSIAQSARSLTQAKPVHEIPEKIAQETKNIAQKVGSSAKVSTQVVGDSVKNMGEKLATGTQSLSKSTKELLSKVNIIKRKSNTASQIAAKPIVVPMTNSTPNALPRINSNGVTQNSGTLRSQNNETMAIHKPLNDGQLSGTKPNLWSKVTAKFSKKSANVQTASNGNSY